MKIRFVRVAPGATPAETRARAPGEAIAVRVEELVPRARYALRAGRRFRGGAFISQLEFDADDDGIIDTAADPDRLFWSMRRATNPAPDGDDVVVTVAHDGRIACEARLGIDRLPPGVRTEPIGDGLVGTVFLPAATTPRPAILTLGGSEGGLERAAHTAAALAGQGFVALALAYFGAPGVPRGLVDISLEYCERALAALRRHPATAPSPIGVLGRSRGGELALLIGASAPEVGPVAALLASPVRWCGTDGAGSAAWRERGAASPYLAAGGPPRAEPTAGGELAYATTPNFDAALDAAGDAGIAAAAIALEKLRGPVLLVSADDDRVWPSRRLAELAVARLAGRVTHEWRSYPSAGHSATAVPGDPTMELATLHPLAGIPLALGGTPEGNAHAQRDTWSRVVAFFRRGLDQF